MNKTASKAAASAVGQLALFNEVVPPVPSRIASLVVPTTRENDEGELVSQSMRLVPMNAKEGHKSLKAENPDMSAADLKALHAQNGQELKEWLVQAAVKLGGNKQVSGVAINGSRSGRIALVFKHRPDPILLVTDEELAKAMGQSVEWIKKHRQSGGGVIIDADKKLKPTPANGTPELVPAKKRSRKKQEPKTPAPTSTPQPQ